MANLRVDKITSTETFETTGSVQFDGTTDFLSLSSSTDFAMGTGDFTAECWVYVVKHTHVEGGYGQRIFDSNTGQLGIYINSDGTGGYVGALVSGADIRPTVAHGIAPEGTWTHAAICRSGDNFRIFVNGREAAYRSGTGSVASSADFRIGARASGEGGFKGHISNLRIIKGKALYTANFKPPMRELEVTPETTLLCCQSKTDAALEKTGKTITVSGDAVANELTPGLLTPVPKAGAGSAITGSVEFGGGTTSNPGDSLSVPNTTDLRLGSSDFTVEAYVNFTNGGVSNGVIVALWDNTDNRRSWNFYFDRSNGLYFAGSTNGSSGNNNVNASIDIEDGEWYHVAACRSGSTIRLFVNGIERASNTSVGTYYENTVDPIRIGAQNNDDPTNFWKGFISNLRIVKGTALYTDDFIPPTRELKKVPGTVLLCCQDPDSPLTEATGKTITGHGNLDTDTYSENLITNGNFTTSASDGWTVVEGTGSTALGTAQSGTFNDGNHLVLTATSGSFVFLAQQFTTKIGSTYLVNVQSNGADESFISTDSDKDNAIITDIRNTGGNNPIGDKTFVATQTTYHMILRGGTGGGNFDTASVYKVLTPNKASNFTPQVGDDRKVTFEGVTKVNSDAYFYLPTGDTASREATGTYNAGTRGIMMGGIVAGGSTKNATIDYWTMASTGDAIDFGDCTGDSGMGAGFASRVRGVNAGGFTRDTANFDYVTITSTGNALDFGDLPFTHTVSSDGGFSSETRGVFHQGLSTGPTTFHNIIDYVTISTTGNAQDFGDTTTTRLHCPGVSSPTRGVWAGGYNPGTVGEMDYVTIASTGNAKDFGDLITPTYRLGGCSSAIRGLFFGGGGAPSITNTISYITIATTGNIQDFGDLVQAQEFTSGTSSSTRGVKVGGSDSSPGPYSPVGTIEYFEIATTGNAQAFGDLSVARARGGTFSNGHGGLG